MVSNISCSDDWLLFAAILFRLAWDYALTNTHTVGFCSLTVLVPNIAIGSYLAISMINQDETNRESCPAILGMFTQAYVQLCYSQVSIHRVAVLMQVCAGLLSRLMNCYRLYTV